MIICREIANLFQQLMPVHYLMLLVNGISEWYTREVENTGESIHFPKYEEL